MVNSAPTMDPTPTTARSSPLWRLALDNLTAFAVSMAVFFLWHWQRWPGEAFAWPIALFLVPGFRIAWTGYRFRSLPFLAKLGIALLWGLVPGLLMGWLTLQYH